MSIAGLSEAVIREHAAPEIYQRGRSYYDRGAVGALVLRDSVMQAQVDGSEYTPYRVHVIFEQAGIAAANCTCAYEWGGWCKHIVAVLLAALYRTGAIENRPALATLLDGLDRGQLQAVLIGLAEHEPELADTIERQVALLQVMQAVPPAQPRSSPRRSSIDTQAIRQQVRVLMQPAKRGRYDDYDDYYREEEDPGDEIVAAVRPLLEQAQTLTASGDALSALDLLQALTTEYLAGCRALSDHFDEMFGGFEGAALEFLDELAKAWADAILSADLSDDERDEWGEQLAGWNDEAADLDADNAFILAVTAADHGWEYPPLQRVLAGEITERGAWAGASPAYADELALVRLHVLERQNRHQEYLYLAEAEGQTDLYTIMLARLGRTQEAVVEGVKYVTSAREALALSKALRERGDAEGALQIAEHGLALKPPDQSESAYSFTSDHATAELAVWAAELAASIGQNDRALRAAETAFRVAPSLAAYQRVEQMAGAQWKYTRPALLEQLRGSRATDAKVDIFLHEALIDDAITAVQNGTSYGYGLLERVVDAAISSRPEWVINAASSQAERIMDAGDAQHYNSAVAWLQRVRAAFRTDNRAGDWQSYLNGIRTKHARKHKLMGLMKGM